MKIINFWLSDRSAAIQYQKGPHDKMWKYGFYNGHSFSQVGRIQTVELVEQLQRVRKAGFKPEMKVIKWERHGFPKLRRLED